MRHGASGSRKVAVPTWTAVAPAMRNSIASSPDTMPPDATIGIDVTEADCQTRRTAIGRIAGPDSPPKAFAIAGRRCSMSIASAGIVLATVTA